MVISTSRETIGVNLQQGPCCWLGIQASCNRLKGLCLSTIPREWRVGSIFQWTRCELIAALSIWRKTLWISVPPYCTSEGAPQHRKRSVFLPAFSMNSHRLMQQRYCFLLFLQYAKHWYSICYMCTKKCWVCSTHKKSVLRSLTFSVRINYENVC